MNKFSITSQPTSPIPPDDLRRNLTVSRPNEDQNLPHLGVVGDTYTILLTGKDTDGRYCLIDMHIPPGGGPPPHRHDFEESFTIIEGEIETTFRGTKSVARVGETVNIPANAPHQFHNASDQPVRLLCLCSPAGQEEFSWRSVSRLQAGRRHPLSSMRQIKRRSKRNPRLLPQNIGRNAETLESS
jgi:quercetin dioxygenase-like cupin family protein